jgi:hypothetical protein
MRALVLASLSLAACSIDWRLARQLPSADAGVPPPSDAGSAGVGTDSGLRAATLLCDQIPALSSDPALDGRLEPELSLYSWLDANTAAAPAGVSALLSIAYRPDALYFFVAITDPTRDPAPADALDYCGDGVELFVDDDGVIQNPPGYDRPGTMQLVVAAPNDAVNAVRRGQRFINPGAGDAIDRGDWTSTRYIAVPTATGYTVEALVVGDDLDLGSWTLARGSTIGWNLSLNIGGPQEPGIDACTTRNQQVHFRIAASGRCTAPYCNASALCATALAAP